MRRRKNRMGKKTVLDFLDMKARGEKITFLTAYDYPLASFAERAGIEMLLVGDSLGMVVYGLAGTIPVTMDEMIIHSRAVRRGAPNTFVIGDMPFMSYQSSVEKAVVNAGRFLKEAEMDAIKLEGGRRVQKQIQAIVEAGIPVMGHIGLTPQSSGQLGGFKAQGRTAEAARELMLDAIAIEEAGAFSILLEAIPPEVGEAITKRLSIPTLGIGAGLHCNGQLLISGDMLGLVEAFTPRFVKKYINLSELITKAISEYVSDIKEMQFPGEKHTYRMKEGEADKLEELVKSLDR
jgi:3-methyl-2-oxobutanoate hydroxymethyltransferase